MSLEIQHVSLAQLLSHDRPFHMARYQRHYEWGRKEMEQLLDDLGDAFDAHADNPAAETFHFVGNVILFENPLGYLEVVDGQQRLTSLTLLLVAARASPAAAELRQELDAVLQITPPGTTECQPRLILHRGDQPFLRNLVLADATDPALADRAEHDLPSAACMRANSSIATAWLAARPAADLAPLIRFVLAGCRFVEILVGSEDDAFRIFETVNNRGRPISNEDVLRYALVEFATTDMAMREAYLARWDEIEVELGPRGMKRFINGWRARLTKGARPRQALHRTVLDNFNSPAEARAFLDTELSGDLSVFTQIENADIGIAPGPVKARIDTIFRSLSLLDFDEWLPVASELVRRGVALPQRLAADLARVERLAWYFYLTRDGKGVYLERRERFAALMKLAAASGTFEALPPRALLNAEQCAEMRDVLQQRLDPKWKPLCSLLVRLEMALADDNAGIARDTVTIEHVLPLRPTAKSWLALYANSLRTVTDNAERIGNLCLVSSDLNSRLGNRIYPAKRKMMIEHGVPARSKLAADIALEGDWTREVIARRSKWLLKVFCDTFDVHAAGR